MGQSPDETLTEIAQIRARIDRGLDDLGAVLPPPEDVIARLVLGLTAGAVVAVGLWYLTHRLGRAREDRRIRRLVTEALREHDASA